MDSSIRRGSWEMVAAMLISGSIGWFVLVSGVSVIEVVFWRCVIGALTLLLVCAWLGYLRVDLLSWAKLGLAVLSGVAIVGNWLLLFESYSRASIAISTAVYNVQPFMLVMLAAVFLGEKITVQKLAWLSVAFLGMLAIVTAHGEQTGGGDYLVGIALALGGGIFVCDRCADHQAPQGNTATFDGIDSGGHWRGTPGAVGTLEWLACVNKCLGCAADLGGRAYRVDVCAAVWRDPEIADRHYWRTVVHLPDCGDLRGLDCVRASPWVAAMAGCGGDSVGSGGVAAGLVVAPQPR